MTNFAKFRIGDLFKIETGSLVPSGKLLAGKIARISAKSENNGVLGYFDTNNISEARHFENFITVNFFGANGGVFYHPYRASVEMKVHVLQLPNHKLNSRTGLYLATCIKKAIGDFSYGTQLSSTKLKTGEFFVELPIDENSKIDFPYMENRIRELEAERIRELEAYLKVTGLSDYTLTPAEQAVLAEFRERERERERVD